MINSLIRLRARRVGRLLSGYVGKEEKVLDLGCGDGMVASCLKRHSGSDIRGAEVVLQKSCMIPVVKFDGTNLPFKDREFDAVMIIWVLHHTTEPEALLREAGRVCKGKIIVIETFYRGYLSRKCLELIDYIENKPWGVPIPFNFKKLGGWKKLFSRAGLKIQSERKIRVSRLDPTISRLFVLRPSSGE